MPATVNLTLPAVKAGSTAGLAFNYYTNAAATILLTDSAAVTVSGTYYIVGITSLGCSDTTAVIVTIGATAIGGSVVNDAFVCSGANGDSLKLIGSSGAIQKWQSSINGGTTWTDIANTTNKLIYSNITTTTWYRAFLKAFCSSANSIEARITVDTSPAPIGGTVAANHIVCGSSNHDTLTLSGQTGNVIRWEYSIDGGTTWVYINDTTTKLICTNLTATTIYHAVLRTSICNIAFSSNDTITVNPLSHAGVISGAVAGCAYSNGGTLTLTGTVGTIVNWQSSPNLGTTWTDITNTTSTQAYVNLSDTVFYRAIVKSGVCFNDTSIAVSVNINPKPVAHFTADTVCLGSVTTFVNSSTITSGTVILNKWDFGNNNSSFLVNPTHTFAQAGTTPVTLILTSDLGCLDTTTVGVFVKQLPNAQINANAPLSFCCGGTVTLSGVSGLHYLWSSFATTQSIVVDNCLSSGTYSLTVLDPVTSCSNISSVPVVIYPNPIASAGNDATISLGNSCMLNGQGGTTYTWSPITGLSNPNIASPSASPAITTTYVLTVGDINNCTSKDSLIVTVNTDYNLTVQNVMTTNGDGYNDKWIVKNVESYPGTEVIIVNREGQQVYYSASYDNSWTGLNKNGQQLPDATYYYFIKFKNSDKVYKGPITIFNEK